MASYHCSIKDPLSRSKGESLMGKAAYNARTQYRNERTGELTKDFSSRGGLLESFVTYDPKCNAPEWFTTDPERMLNAAASAEKRKDAREGQEIVFGFIDELGLQKNKWMLNDFLREQFTRRDIGRVAFVNIHEPSATGDQRNYHAHVLLILREAGPDGFGERLPGLEPEDYERIRQKWAERGAKELRKEANHSRQAGDEQRAGLLELEADRYAEGWRLLEQQRQAALERGDLAYAETLKDKKASKHRGPKADAMERRGIETDRGNIYRDTVESNAQSQANNEALRIELEAVQNAIAEYEREWADQVAAAGIEKEKIERRFVEPSQAPERGTLAAPADPGRELLAEIDKSIADDFAEKWLQDPARYEQQYRDIQQKAPALAKEIENVVTAAYAQQEEDAAAARKRDLAAIDRLIAQATLKPPDPIRERPTGQIPAQIWDALESSDSARSFAAAMEQRGLYLAAASEEEAQRSRMNAAYPKAIGGLFVPEYQPGEIVAVTERGQVYQLTPRTTGRERQQMQFFLEPLRQQLPTIEAAQERQQQHVNFSDAARRVGRDSRTPDHLHGTAAQIWVAYHRSDSAQSFAAALEENGISIARTTKEEAEQSRIEAEAAKSEGRYASAFRENELVAVDDRGQVYRFSERVTGTSFRDMQAYLRTLDTQQLPTIEAIKQRQQQRINEKHWPTMPPVPEPIKTSPELHFSDAAREVGRDARPTAAPDHLHGTAAQIWLASHRSDNARSFAAALEENGILIARTTKEEAEQSRIEAEAAKSEGRYASAFRENEFVAVDDRGQVYRFSERVTGTSFRDMQAYLRTLDTPQPSIIEARQTMHDRAAAYEAGAQVLSALNPVQRTTRQKPGRALQDSKRVVKKAIRVTDKAIIAPAAKAGAIVDRTLGNALGAAAKLFEGLFDMFDPGPPKTRREIENAIEEQDRAAATHEKDQHQAERHADYSADHERLMDVARQQRELDQQREKDFKRYRGDDRER